MTDRPDAAALVALVGSRIAHDLASPVGAIANGVELLGLTGLDGSPELGLISESVANASTRIKLFRVAFGAATAGQSIAAGEIAQLTAPSPDGRRVDIDWQIAGDIPRPEAKRAFLALMCLETAMPWGGAAKVSREAQALRIEARAERTNIDPALWDYLAGAAPAPADLSAAQVQFALLKETARADNRPLTVQRSETAITLTV